MDRKLVAIDLDGTTLNNDSQLTHETESAIRKVVEQGHIVSIATGRPFRTSQQFYKQLRLDTPIVNFNGAWCHHPNDYNWENGYHKRLDRDIALSLLPLSRFPIVKLISAESQDHIYVDRAAEETYSTGSPIRNVPTVPFTKENLQESPTSVNVFTAEEYFIPFIQNRIIEHYGDEIEVRTWGGPTPTLEIVAAGIQKAMGVEEIAKYYNISQDNIIAFGDEANDFEMIQYAGLGVMMKNGIDGLKEVADDVTSYTNHEHGLAKYLTEYFNL
ncbi:MAG TPA: Cof-type HAD-IIB family hydrolase [Candidatus Atopostipes pullistercoris]|uniref:Cof-type HAD-IIB family hydrolase n=1 Tax=Candidatus Atopostipes pullistercoris TaxID=2838467 RepID=A0A9D2JYH4_9LACT|nr:Cof-type HAD-IIB family hydrolase [Candidatus Atopostipes pullistercoris]